jgi:hypothetical protein
MTAKMSGFLGEREMADVLELLAAPAERDLPPGRAEQRKRMLLETIAADLAAAPASQTRSRLRRIVSWLGCLLAVAAIAVGAGKATGVAAHADRGHVVEVAAVVGAGSAIALHAAPTRSASDTAAKQRLALARAAVVAS